MRAWSIITWSDIASTLLADLIQAIVGWSHGTIWGLRLDKQIGVHNMIQWRHLFEIDSEIWEFGKHHWNCFRFWPTGAKPRPKFGL
jgi:hypothetical protein